MLRKMLEVNEIRIVINCSPIIGGKEHVYEKNVEATFKINIYPAPGNESIYIRSNCTMFFLPYHFSGPLTEGLFACLEHLV